MTIYPTTFTAPLGQVYTIAQDSGLVQVLHDFEIPILFDDQIVPYRPRSVTKGLDSGLPETRPDAEDYYITLYEPLQRLWYNLISRAAEKLGWSDGQFEQAWGSVIKGGRAFTDFRSPEDGYWDAIRNINPGALPIGKETLFCGGAVLRKAGGLVSIGGKQCQPVKAINVHNILPSLDEIWNNPNYMFWATNELPVQLPDGRWQVDPWSQTPGGVPVPIFSETGVLYIRTDWIKDVPVGPIPSPYVLPPPSDPEISLPGESSYQRVDLSTPRPVSYHVARIDLQNAKKFVVSRKPTAGMTISQFFADYGPVVAINGDEHRWSGGIPYVNGWGKSTWAGVTSTYGQKGEPTFSIGATDFQSKIAILEAGLNLPTFARNSVSGSHILIKGGTITSGLDNTIVNARSAIGYAGRWLYMVMVHGVEDGSRGMTLKELAQELLARFHIQYLLNLDGGRSSQFRAGNKVFVGDGTAEEEVANFIGVFL